MMRSICAGQLEMEAADYFGFSRQSLGCQVRSFSRKRDPHLLEIVEDILSHRIGADLNRALAVRRLLKRVY
jgi:hypothetical protein